MIALRLSEAAAFTKAALVPGPARAETGGPGRQRGVRTPGEVFFRGAGIDSRTLQPGALFIALRGERHDGHDHIGEAVARGAAALMVERDAPLPLPGLRVPDTRQALGQLAAGWRQRFHPPLVAVTGSNGKTTVKDMVAAVCAQAGQVLATRGNLNNDIGMPLTLFGLDAGHRYVVLELGANHPGELAGLAAIARPDVAVITGCGAAHLAGFGSLEGAAMGEGGEIFAGLTAGGTAVINGDDPYAGLWRALASAFRVLSFGCQGSRDVLLEQHSPRPDGRPGARLQVRTPRGRLSLELALPGEHNLRNALAAVAVGEALALPPEAIATALAGVRPPRGRLEHHRGASGALIIDDSYNANPASLAAGLAVLTAPGGPCWLALGDMGELGPQAGRLHREAGEQARALGVQRLYALGPLCAEAAAGFGAGARHFDSMQALSAALRADIGPGVRLLVKGSRAMAMERLVRALLEAEETPC